MAENDNVKLKTDTKLRTQHVNDHLLRVFAGCDVVEDAVGRLMQHYEAH